MIEPNPLTWLLLIFGVITLLPLMLTQLLMLVRPRSRLTRELLVGKDEDWRDDTHFRNARGLAWADWLLLLPLLVIGSIGVVKGTAWGYLLWGSSGAITLYINLVLWFMEKDYVYPSRGAWAYYSYYWGFFVLWGSLALGYSVVRLAKYSGALP